MEESIAMVKRFLTRALSVCILALAVFTAGLPVMAASPGAPASERPDHARKGSVTAEIRDTDGCAVPGGSLTVIAVADAVYEDGNDLLVFKEAFDGCGLDLSGIGREESGAPGLAEELADWARKKGIEGREEEIDAQGRAVFKDLSLGLYLFVQKTPADGYESIHPFLVTVPLWDGEKLVYDVEADPKAGRAMGLASIEVPAEKVLKAESGSLPEGEIFTFRIVPHQKEYPMPAVEGALQDPETGAVLVTHGAGKFSFGKIWFASEDIGKTFAYTVSELPGGNSCITYDDALYRLTVEVIKDEASGRAVCRTSITGRDGKEVPGIVFTNLCSDPSSQIPPLLPQTGQLWWPVPLLFLAGILLIGAGRFLGGRSR